jgi:putative DNA primase/helicase
MERLLSIIGEAPLTVDRKNKEPLTVKLPTRIMMSANELLQFPDEVGAMQTRMLVLVFTKSFVGREKRDEEFKDLFLAELPGILNWALAGLRRLNEAGGRFTPPVDSQEVTEELRDAGNQVRPFVRDHCELGDSEDHWIWVDELYGMYAETRGGFKDDAAQKDRFGRELKAAFPGIMKKRKRKEGVLTYYYTGVTLLLEYRGRAAAMAAELEAMREAARWAKGLRG